MRNIKLTKFGKFTVAILGIYSLLYLLATSKLLDVMYTLLGMFFIAILSWNIYEYIYKPIKIKLKIKTFQNKVKKAYEIKTRTEIALTLLDSNIDERISNFKTEQGKIKCVEFYLTQKEFLEKNIHASLVILKTSQFELEIFNSILHYNLNNEMQNNLDSIITDIDINIDIIENNMREFQTL